MNPEANTDLRSSLTIAGHTPHPLLVTLPIGFLVGVLLSDLAFFGTSDAFWVRASQWLVGAGLAAGVLAALAGFIDFIGNERIRTLTYVWYHFLGNAIALILSAVSLHLRVSAGAQVVTGAELVLSILVVVIFVFTCWLGGELVF